MQFSRRQLITTAAAFSALPQTVFANTPTEITWDDLIPPGVPYSEIIGEGEIDELNDVWRPIFDEIFVLETMGAQCCRKVGCFRPVCRPLGSLMYKC